jgi:hypothetical protein
MRTILPFPVENHQACLSIKPDDADIGVLYREYYSMVYTDLPPLLIP